MSIFIQNRHKSNGLGLNHRISQISRAETTCIQVQAWCSRHSLSLAPQTHKNTQRRKMRTLFHFIPTSYRFSQSSWPARINFLDTCISSKLTLCCAAKKKVPNFLLFLSRQVWRRQSTFETILRTESRSNQKDATGIRGKRNINDIPESALDGHLAYMIAPATSGRILIRTCYLYIEMTHW